MPTPMSKRCLLRISPSPPPPPPLKRPADVKRGTLEYVNGSLNMRGSNYVQSKIWFRIIKGLFMLYSPPPLPLKRKFLDPPSDGTFRKYPFGFQENTFGFNSQEHTPHRIWHNFVKADLHSTIFAYDCRMRFL